MSQFGCRQNGVLCRKWGSEKPNMSCLLCTGWESSAKTLSKEDKELLDFAKEIGKDGLAKLKELLSK